MQYLQINILLFLLSNSIFGNIEKPIDYNYLTGNYNVLDSTYTGEFSIVDTVNGFRLELCRFNIFNGQINGRVIRSVWSSPYVQTSVPNRQIIEHFYKGKRHGRYEVYENENDSLILKYFGEYIDGKKEGCFYYFVNNNLNKSERYIGGRLLELTYFDSLRSVNIFYCKESGLIDRVSFIEASKHYNHINIEFESSNMFRIRYQVNDKLVNALSFEVAENSVKWISQYPELFIYEIDFEKGFRNKGYLLERIDSLKSRRAIK